MSGSGLGFDLLSIPLGLLFIVGVVAVLFWTI